MTARDDYPTLDALAVEIPAATPEINRALDEIDWLRAEVVRLTTRDTEPEQDVTYGPDGYPTS